MGVISGSVSFVSFTPWGRNGNIKYKKSRPSGPEPHFSRPSPERTRINWRMKKIWTAKRGRRRRRAKRGRPTDGLHFTNRRKKVSAENISRTQQSAAPVAFIIHNPGVGVGRTRSRDADRHGDDVVEAHNAAAAPTIVRRVYYTRNNRFICINNPDVVWAS